jgi:hypothetical protein
VNAPRGNLEHARRRGRLRRLIGAAAAAGLVLLGLAYWLTYEPAPRVRVRWRPDLMLEQQAALERKYLLRNRRDPLPGGSLAYDLLDTSASNIGALVEEPSILDTNDIERHTLTVRFDVDYGDEWMWIAYRLPGLRNSQARTLLLIVLALMALGGLTPDAVHAWRAVREAAAGHRKHGKPPGSNVPVG